MNTLQSLSAAATPAHLDPAAALAAALLIVLLTAKLSGHVSLRFGQPAVLGELLGGVLLGNLSLVGLTQLDWMKVDPNLDILARLGVMVLMFEVGLESTVADMVRVGRSSLLVAIIGVLVPFAGGWIACTWLLPGSSAYTHAFIGATLSATSVGITARVLQDLNVSKTNEARIILGAAVIDDVLGLLMLAILAGTIGAAETGGALAAGKIAVIVSRALYFLAGALLVGTFAAPRIFVGASRLRGKGILLATGLSLCFALAWLADKVGLAAIVGAFAAGLMLERMHYQRFVDRDDGDLATLVSPLSSLLVPVFFVLMGLRTNLNSFAAPSILALAGTLTLVAIGGKQACAIGVLGRGVDRLSVGIGMIPRGEVGLIFANIGLGLTLKGQPVIGPAVYSAIVVVVIVTTMITPPALKWSFQRRLHKRPIAEDL